MRYMTPTRQDILDQALAIEEGLDAADVVKVGKALERLGELVTVAFAAPSRVVVGKTHLEDATSLLTSYLESDPENRLLAQVLGDIDDRLAVDAAYRLGVLGAMAQLAADGLTAAVLESSGWDGTGELDEEKVRDATRNLLSHLVMARCDNRPLDTL